MNKNYIQFLETETGIDKWFYPMDIYFPTVKKFTIEEKEMNDIVPKKEENRIQIKCKSPQKLNSLKSYNFKLEK